MNLGPCYTYGDTGDGRARAYRALDEFIADGEDAAFKAAFKLDSRAIEIGEYGGSYLRESTKGGSSARSNKRTAGEAWTRRARFEEMRDHLLDACGASLDVGFALDAARRFAEDALADGDPPTKVWKEKGMIRIRGWILPDTIQGGTAIIDNDGVIYLHRNYSTAAYKRTSNPFVGFTPPKWPLSDLYGDDDPEAAKVIRRIRKWRRKHDLPGSL